MVHRVPLGQRFIRFVPPIARVLLPDGVIGWDSSRYARKAGAGEDGALVKKIHYMSIIQTEG